MWMEEKIGERINNNRTAEAVATGAEQIAVACPFCRVMLSDGLTSLQAGGNAREEVEVLDVAQMLLAAVKREPDPDAVSAEPSAGDATQTEETLTDQQDVGADAAARKEPDAEKESGVDPGARGGTSTAAEEQPDKLY
jgi:hypothetical protein